MLLAKKMTISFADPMHNRSVRTEFYFQLLWNIRLEARAFQKRKRLGFVLEIECIREGYKDILLEDNIFFGRLVVVGDNVDGSLLAEGANCLHALFLFFHVYWLWDVPGVGGFFGRE